MRMRRNFRRAVISEEFVLSAVRSAVGPFWRDFSFSDLPGIETARRVPRGNINLRGRRLIGGQLISR